MFMLSLRARLFVTPSVVVLAALVATLAFVLHTTRMRVAAETGPGMRLAELLVSRTLREIGPMPDDAALLKKLASDLPPLRHVELFVRPVQPKDAHHSASETQPERAGAHANRVPNWFVRLVEPPPQSAAIPVWYNGQIVGEVRVVSNPLDEIAEIWAEWKFLAMLLCLLGIAIVALLRWTSGMALRPLADLAKGLEALERGRFESISPPVRLAELRPIALRFDNLARALRELGEANHRLIERLMLVQEAERKDIARELHDEFGPSLFAIRAEAASLLRLAAKMGEQGAKMVERAEAIGMLADTIQRSTSRLLERLRPLILEQMGLAEALRQLVQSFEERSPEIGFVLELPPQPLHLQERAALGVFRIVQECLTNAVRHAKARTVTVRLSFSAAGALVVSVEDDGCGIVPKQRPGFGLMGMQERARALGGELSLARGSLGGTRVAITLPLAESQMMADAK